MVDAFNDVLKKMVADPPNADLGDLLAVAVNPEYQIRLDTIRDYMGRQISITGWVIPVGKRDVGAEAVVDGRTEIKVTQCNEDEPNARVIAPGVDDPPPGEPRNLDEYTVQWQDDVQDWRVARRTRLEGPC
jgi:hypothetical protein